MRRSSAGCLVMAVFATAAVSMATASEAGASSRHVRAHRHHRTNLGLNFRAGAMAPMAAPVSRGDVCPGNARAIDCKIWPPPYDDDPDRKATSSDGGA